MAHRRGPQGKGRHGRVTVGEEELAGLGLREPCPCGSGKRVKNCHGRTTGRAARSELVGRPFQGLPSEVEWVAMREFVPAATATVRLAAEVVGADPEVAVTLTTVLPLAAPASRAADGGIWVALQTSMSSGDASRDLAAALEAALAQDEPGLVTMAGLPAPGPRLQDLLDVAPDRAGDTLDVELFGDFAYWERAVGAEAGDALVRASRERAEAAIVATRRVPGVSGAYVATMAERTYLRWAQPYEEASLLDELARLKTAGQVELSEQSRLLGTFRAHGLLVPVWELPVGTRAEDLAEPVALLAGVLDDRLGQAAGSGGEEPLTPEERRSREGLVNRQLTLR